jgi:hypothetical protein
MDPTHYIDPKNDENALNISLVNTHIRELEAMCDEDGNVHSDICKATVFEKIALIEGLMGVKPDSPEIKELKDSLMYDTATDRDATTADIIALRKEQSAAHDHHADDGSDSGARFEDFSAPFWTKVIFAGLASAIVYRLATFYVPEVGEQDLGDQYAETRKWVAIAQKEADDQMILRELGHPEPISRIDFEGVFDRRR